jgi:hypothetical protein
MCDELGDGDGVYAELCVEPYTELFAEIGGGRLGWRGPWLDRNLDIGRKCACLSLEVLATAPPESGAVSIGSGYVHRMLDWFCGNDVTTRPNHPRAVLRLGFWERYVHVAPHPTHSTFTRWKLESYS